MMMSLLLRVFFPLVRFTKKPISIKAYSHNLLLSIATFTIFILPVYLFPISIQEDGTSTINVAQLVALGAALAGIWFGLIAFGTYLPGKKDKRYRTGRKGNDTGNASGGLVLFCVASHLFILATFLHFLMEVRINDSWDSFSDVDFVWYWLVIQNLINGYMYAIYPYLYDPFFKAR